MPIASTSRQCLARRTICSSVRRAAPEASSPATSNGTPAAKASPSQTGARGRGKAAEDVSTWLAGDGARYKRPLKRATNWLSRVPFPMNPTFSPKPPVSDKLRNLIYNQVKTSLSSANPPKESVLLRELAQKHNLSADRVKAIVKLKVAQDQYVNRHGLALQTALSEGMESALGVSSAQSRLMEPTDGVEPVLTHQMRQIFEMPDVEAGEKPFLPGKLDEADAAKRPDSSSSTASSAPRHSETRRVPSRRKPNAPMLAVQDVSATPLGRYWERSNRNDSASAQVQRERKAERELKKKENEIAWEAY